MDSLNITKILFIVMSLAFIAMIGKGLFPRGAYERAHSELITFGVVGLVLLTIASAAIYGT
jgi:hypothetical protein